MCFWHVKYSERGSSKQDHQCAHRKHLNQNYIGARGNNKYIDLT